MKENDYRAMEQAHIDKESIWEKMWRPVRKPEEWDLILRKGTSYDGKGSTDRLTTGIWRET